MGRPQLTPVCPPSLTTTQRDALSSPAAGSIIYNSTNGRLEQYLGSAWGAILGGKSIDNVVDFTSAYGAALTSATDQEFEGDGTSLPSGWSWVNQGGATYSEHGGAGSIVGTQQSGDNYRIMVRSCPSESTWTAYFKLTGFVTMANFSRFGCLIRDGSNAFVDFGIASSTSAAPLIVAAKWTNPTTISAALSGSDIVDGSLPRNLYYRIRKNSSTSYDFEFSPDGLVWRSLIAAYNPSFTVTEVGFGTNANGTSRPNAISCHWYRAR